MITILSLFSQVHLVSLDIVQWCTCLDVGVGLHCSRRRLCTEFRLWTWSIRFFQLRLHSQWYCCWSMSHYPEQRRRESAYRRPCMAQARTKRPFSILFRWISRLIHCSSSEFHAIDGQGISYNAEQERSARWERVNRSIYRHRTSTVAFSNA